MSEYASRRRFLGAAAGIVGGAIAAPILCAGTAFARPGELPIVNRPDHPGAQYPPGATRRSHPEPLNASVDCGLSGRAA